MPRLLEFVGNDFSINHRRVNVILHGAKAMLNIGETAGLARLLLKALFFDTVTMENARRSVHSCTP